MNGLGILNNVVSSGFSVSVANFNLVKELPRVQNFSYTIRPRLEMVASINRAGTITAVNNGYDIEGSCEYIVFGVLPELRLGLYCNHNVTPSSLTTLYNNNTGVFLLSGYHTRDFSRSNHHLFGWPLRYRDCRNIFVAIDSTNTNDDLNNQNTIYSEIHPRASGLSVFGFGNCYVTNYRVHGEVGAFPRAAFGFVAENINVYYGGGGFPSPAVNPFTEEQVTGVPCAIPDVFKSSPDIPALKPSDISVFLRARPRHAINVFNATGALSGAAAASYNTVVNLYSGHLQSYDITMELNRTPIYSVSSRIPIDRPLKYPVPVTANLTLLEQLPVTGSLLNALRRNDYLYDIEIKIRNHNLAPLSGDAVSYTLLGCEYVSAQSNLEINTRQNATLSFATELSPTPPYQRGLFISGQLNAFVASMQDTYLVTDANDYLITDAGDYFIINNTNELLY